MRSPRVSPVPAILAGYARYRSPVRPPVGRIPPRAGGATRALDSATVWAHEAEATPDGVAGGLPLTRFPQAMEQRRSRI
jgi:hypothetical protein